MSSGRTPTVFVCRKCKGHAALVRFLHRETGAIVREIGCQDVCREPVCGLRVAGSLEWFCGMDDKKRRRALVRLLTDPGRDTLPGPLAGARSRKRARRVPG